MKNAWEIDWSSNSAFMIERGIMVIIDASKLDKVKRENWTVRIKKNPNREDNIEVSAIKKIQGRRTTVQLSRILLDVEVGSDELVVRCDVSDKDIFDARVSNLVIYPEYRERNAIHYDQVKRKKVN